MTEKQKMLMGILYHASDRTLIEERDRTKSLTKQYNESRQEDRDHRRYLIDVILANVGNNVRLEAPIHFDYGYRTMIGNDFFSDVNLTILDAGSVRIGNHVYIGPNVGIYTVDRPMDARRREKGYEWALPVKIEDNVWIGGDVTIMPGVTIGKNSVIKAGSVVTDDIPANVVAVGNPCKVIKETEKGDRYGIINEENRQQPIK